MEEGGVTELVAGMSPVELKELNDLEDDLYNKWCPEKAARALPLLEKHYEVLEGELKRIEARIPKDRHSDEYAAQRHLADHAEHIRYDLELTQLRRARYEAGLKHGLMHPEVESIKARTASHIRKWLGLRA